MNEGATTKRTNDTFFPHSETNRKTCSLSSSARPRRLHPSRARTGRTVLRTGPTRGEDVEPALAEVGGEDGRLVQERLRLFCLFGREVGRRAERFDREGDEVVEQERAVSVSENKNT